MNNLVKQITAGVTAMVLEFGLLVAPAAAEPAEAMVADAAFGVATVEAIDRQTREITLKGDTKTTTITAGPEVRNFDRIKRGDLVVFEYFEGLAVAVVPAAKGVPARQDSITLARTAQGEKPGVAVKKTIDAEGKVKAIDKKNRILTVEGKRRTVALKVADDVNLSGISVGDAVVARYESAYAIAVIPPTDVDAEVLIESQSIAIGVGYDWGEGTLIMRNGSRHKVKVEGISVVDVGITKTEASGYVYNLEDLNDFPGYYSRAEAGITLVGGGSTAILKNNKGVLIRMTSKDAGIKLKVAPGGMKFALVE